MKVVVQRCKDASVRVDGKVTGQIPFGLMVLVGFTEGDDFAGTQKMAKKITSLRIFDDENGVMNLSVQDVGGSILSISQFTLYADTKKGNRPSYISAMKGDKAILLYEEFNRELRNDVEVETGTFGADMEVDFKNIGPVTIIMEG